MACGRSSGLIPLGKGCQFVTARRANYYVSRVVHNSVSRRRRVIHRRLRGDFSRFSSPPVNNSGIPIRVARNELPWVMAACAPQLRRSCAINRNNAMPQSLRRGLLIREVTATSSRLRGVLPEVSQGSSLLATLGFIAESLWDSRSLASIEIRVGCSEDGRTALNRY